MWKMTRDGWIALGVSVVASFMAGALAVHATSSDNWFEGGLAGVAAVIAYWCIMLTLGSLRR